MAHEPGYCIHDFFCLKQKAIKDIPEVRGVLVPA